MTVDDVFASSRTIIVAGKGGVGKTTVSAALACAAAQRGLRVLFIELDGKPIPAELTSGEGHISTMSLTAGDALVDYLEHHGLGRLAKRFAATGILDVIAAAAPGLDDLLVLGRIKALERSSPHDVIIVDGPAAGHALTFLRVAHGIRGGIRTGLIATQASEVGEFLADHARCSVAMVTLPATTPVTETVDTALAIEDEIGVALGPIVVEVVEPLRRLRFILEPGEDRAIACDLTWEGAIPAFEEPRQYVRKFGRVLFDTVRFAQTGCWSGELEVAGERFTVTPDRWKGTRDRSWGVRPVGEAEPAGIREEIGQMVGFWNYAPMQFDDFSIL